MQSAAPIGAAEGEVLRADPGCNRAIAWAQLRARTRLDMAQVFRSPAYFVLLVLGLIHSVLGLHAVNPMWGTSSLPVTRLMIDLLNGSFTLIPLVVAIYYSSELVWLYRDISIN